MHAQLLRLFVTRGECPTHELTVDHALEKLHRQDEMNNTGALAVPCSNC